MDEKHSQNFLFLAQATDQAVFASEEYVHRADHAIAKDEGEAQADEGDILKVCQLYPEGV